MKFKERNLNNDVNRNGLTDTDKLVIYQKGIV